jgi:hypothetical protein
MFRKSSMNAVFAVIFPIFLFPCGTGLFAQPAQPQVPEFSLEGGTTAPCPTPDQYSLVRPDPPGVVTRVEVGVVFNDVFEIKDVEQLFTADVYIALRWRDARLADPSRGTAVASCKLPEDQVWMPALDPRNVREVERNFRDITLIDAEGTITHVQRVQISTVTPLDLSDFPFDHQTLTIAVDSFLGVQEVELAVWEDILGRVGEFSVAGWNLGEPRAEVVQRYGQVRRINYSSLLVQIPAEREMGFYVRKLIIPLALIVFMAWAIFWIPPSQIAPQMGVGATSMLTLIAYHFAMGGILPPVSYLTRVDHFMLWSLILVFLALMEAVATAALVNFGKESLVHKMDLVCRMGYPVAFLLILGMTIF